MNNIHQVLHAPWILLVLCLCAGLNEGAVPCLFLNEEVQPHLVLDVLLELNVLELLLRDHWLLAPVKNMYLWFACDSKHD